jgi:hypothetical protein
MFVLSRFMAPSSSRCWNNCRCECPPRKSSVCIAAAMAETSAKPAQLKTALLNKDLFDGKWQSGCSSPKTEVSDGDLQRRYSPQIITFPGGCRILAHCRDAGRHRARPLTGGHLPQVSTAASSTFATIRRRPRRQSGGRLNAANEQARLSGGIERLDVAGASIAVQARPARRQSAAGRLDGPVAPPQAARRTATASSG